MYVNILGMSWSLPNASEDTCIIIFRNWSNTWNSRMPVFWLPDREFQRYLKVRNLIRFSNVTF